MEFLSELLQKRFGKGWDQLEVDNDARNLVAALEAALEPVIKAAGPALIPSLALRAEELVVSWLIARRMEDVLVNEGVCRMQEDPNPQTQTKNADTGTKPPAAEAAPTAAPADTAQNAPTAKSTRFKEVHPMVEKAMKARERVRKALQELETACKASAATGGTGALGDEISPLLRLAGGVLDDALAFEKRKSKRATRSASGASS